MEIKKLIEDFELAIPTYQRCVDEKWNKEKIIKHNIHLGICHYLYCIYDVNIVESLTCYYKNYMKSYYLFKVYVQYNSIAKCIKPRLDFMKSEVKDLKRLLKQGYTHV